MIYLATVTANTLAHSKEKGTPSVEIQVRTKLNLTTGEQIAKTMTGNLWLTASTADRTSDTLETVFGWAGQSFAELNMPVLAGIEVEVVTQEESYNGKTYEKIAFWNRPGESSARELKPVEAAQARAIASQYDAVLRNRKAKAGTQAPAPRQQPTAAAPAYTGPEAGSDLPF
jgi:hypothetical protein